jgi:hypothetical protein
VQIVFFVFEVMQEFVHCAKDSDHQQLFAPLLLEVVHQVVNDILHKRVLPQQLAQIVAGINAKAGSFQLLQVVLRQNFANCLHIQLTQTHRPVFAKSVLEQTLTAKPEI